MLTYLVGIDIELCADNAACIRLVTQVGRWEVYCIGSGVLQRKRVCVDGERVAL